MPQPDDLEQLFQSVARRALAYRASLADRPQRPEKSYDEMRGAFDGPLPEHGAPGADVISHMAEIAEPGLGVLAGPRFFGWVIGASHPVGVAADWLTSAWGQNTGSHLATPAAAAVEETAARWLLELFDLPRGSSVGFVTGASIANFVGLAAARHKVLRRLGWDVERQGLFGAPPIHLVIGDDAHTSVFSAIKFLGLGFDRVHRVATDDAGRMEIDAFRATLDKFDGPIIAIAQAGQINTGAFDRFAELADMTHHRNGWLHVDGAFGLWARACPDLAPLAAGLEQADSWAVDGHKWLQTPYDSGYTIVRDPEAHASAMATEASYLPQLAEGHRNPSHFVPELSRRARGFATWAMIRHLGRDGIAEMVSRHCRIARAMAERLAAEPDVEILNEVDLNQVILRFGDSDDLTQAVIERVQADGTCFVGGARWRDRWVMRISVISWPTSDADGAISAEAIAGAWGEVRSAGGHDSAAS
jgi:glutamate/tyrosine decarboxylase-like PLP-dependent enzyme